MNPEHRKSTQGGARLEKKPTASRRREKKPRPQLTRKQKTLRILFLVLTVIAAVIVVAAIAYRLLVVKPEPPGITPPAMESSGEIGDYGDGPRLYGDRKEDFFTFMLLGRDTGGGGNTDTIIVMSYDIPNQKLNVISIPRDTMVNVPWDVKKINSVYNYAPYYDKDGVEFVREEVSYLIGFQPDYTFVVEWEAVGELVDAVGPVTFDVPVKMDYEDPDQDLYIHLDAGVQEIDGDKAMQLLRWRKNNKIVDGKLVIYGGYPNGDLGRIETQQAFLKVLFEKCLTSIGLDTIPQMAKIFVDNVDISDNLTMNNIAWFAQEAVLGGLSVEDINFVTLPITSAYAYSRTYGQDLDYVVPIADEMLEIINQYFNPYLEDLELNELDIMSVNADGTLSSTRGVVEDTKANAAVQSSKPSSNPEPAETVEPVTEVSETPASSPEAAESPAVSPSIQPAESPAASITPEATPTPPSEPAATPTPAVTPTSAATPAPVSTPAATEEIEYGPGMEPVA